MRGTFSMPKEEITVWDGNQTRGTTFSKPNKEDQIMGTLHIVVGWDRMG
jgi:hypothetical protein